MQKTNVQVTGAAGALAMIFMWLLGWFAPDLMATAPVGLEAGITTLIITGVGLAVGANRSIVGKIQ